MAGEVVENGVKTDADSTEVAVEAKVDGGKVECDVVANGVDACATEKPAVERQWTTHNEDTGAKEERIHRKSGVEDNNVDVEPKTV